MRATARIDLARSSDGGLVGPIPSPCQSLLLRVEPDAGEEPIDFGVLISTDDGRPLTPGKGTAVRLEFWSDLSDVYVLPGTEFTLRYPHRIVGQGRVLDVLPF